MEGMDGMNPGFGPPEEGNHQLVVKEGFCMSPLQEPGFKYQTANPNRQGLPPKNN